MRFASLFSGIGGFDLGLERAGMECVFQCEIDTHCGMLLGSKWPEVRKEADVRAFGADLAGVDLICGGFPCQDLSVAGRRAGLAGERSGLWSEFHRILEVARPRWCLIENVPGLLSSNEGRDFAIILRGLVELGYGVSWRVLDSQFFGLAQRRKRVFIVGSLGSGASAQVLFEPACVSGDSPPRRETREGSAFLAPAMPASGRGFSRDGESRGQDPVIPDIAWALQERDAKGADSDTKDGHLIPIGFNATQDPITSDDMVGAMSNQGAAVALRCGVRRLTPTECERLQGFPDGWTAGFSDTVRYRMLGNAVSVPVAEWIGTRVRVWAA